MKVEGRSSLELSEGRSQGATARVLVKVENRKFTRTVGGKVKGYDREGSSEGGKAEVHWNCRRESHGVLQRGF